MQQQIAVAMHKEAWYPADSLYLPVQAGAALHAPLGVTGDDTGVSISRSNPQYSELTALYWLWQNSGAQVRGLCHYRRYFAGRRLGTKAQRILTGDRLEALMQSADVIVPVPRLYLIETNRSHYAHAHQAQDLDAVRLHMAVFHPVRNGEAPVRSAAAHNGLPGRKADGRVAPQRAAAHASAAGDPPGKPALAPEDRRVPDAQIPGDAPWVSRCPK